jgi:hypothetical protein
MTAKLFADVKPGDRLFRVQDGRNSSAPKRTDWVVVTKVGRKWVDFAPEGQEPRKWNSGRFDVEDGRIDGGQWQSPGSVHKDEAAWRAHEAVKAAWKDFRWTIERRYAPAPGVSEADILKAAELLKVDLKP